MIDSGRGVQAAARTEADGILRRLWIQGRVDPEVGLDDLAGVEKMLAVGEMIPDVGGLLMGRMAIAVMKATAPNAESIPRRLTAFETRPGG